MNNNRNNNRRRGRGNNRNQGGANSGNRIDSRARGNAPQLLDKYKKLAQDAQHNGDRVQAAAETYMGQVEVGVGLIPAGCGTKELTVRAIDATARGADPMPRLQQAFETIGFGKVSTSAGHARHLGLLRDVDGITMNRERLMADAKETVLDRMRDGYRAPAQRTSIRVGGEAQRATFELGIHLAWRGGRISDHDALIGRAIARIMTGGDLPQAATVPEQYLLDLEREAFLSLCGEAKTLERIRHTLKTGKTLRN